MQPLHSGYIKDWFELEDFNDVKTLIEKGWLVDFESEYILFAHPILSVIIKTNYRITVDECERMIECLNAFLSYLFKNGYDTDYALSLLSSVIEYFKHEESANESLGVGILYSK